jgi:16S rRNA (cytidine1402-2'-O)-methyltransferase
VITDSLAHVVERVKTEANMRKGEFVVLVEGAVLEKKPNVLTEEQERILLVLLKECSIKTAVSMMVEMTGARKKIVYQAALELKVDKIEH